MTVPEAPGRRGPGAHADQVIGLLALLGLFALIGLGSLGFPPRARTYPMFVGGAGLLLAVAELALTVRRRRRGEGLEPGEAAGGVAGGLRQILPYLTWLAAYFATIALVGLVLASGLFVAFFLNREGAVRWPLATVALLGVCAFLIVTGAVFNLHWPDAVADPLDALGLL